MKQRVSDWKVKRARFIAKWVAQLHRLRIPLTDKVLLPLNVKGLEKSLAELHDVFERHGICFWLRDGTALGVVRGGRIIASDDDVDIGIWAHDLPAVERAVEDLEKIGFVAYDKRFFMINLLRRWESIEIVISKSWDADDTYHHFVDTFFEDLKTVEYLGRKFNVPSRSEAYLEFCYGPDWRIPKSSSWWSSSSFLPKEERDAYLENFINQAKCDLGPDAKR